MLRFNGKQHLHLDPDAEALGGGAADDSSPAGEAAPVETQFDPSQFVPVSKFQELEQRLGETTAQYERRIAEFESRFAPKQDNAPKRPALEDYDFTKPGEWDKYQDDLHKYKFREFRSEWEKEQQENAQKQGYTQHVQSIQDAHAARADQFRAVNPEYDPNASVKIDNEHVALAILESDFSAHIHNLLQKDKSKTAELQRLARSNPAAAIRMVGRLESQFEAKADVETKNKPIATPTKGAFGGSSKASGEPDAKALREKYSQIS